MLSWHRHHSYGHQRVPVVRLLIGYGRSGHASVSSIDSLGLNLYLLNEAGSLLSDRVLAGTFIAIVFYGFMGL